MYWFPLAFFAAKFAKYLNNPNSSKSMDNNVIEKNNTNIFNGLILVLAVNWLNTSSIGANENISSAEAPIKAMIQ